MNWRCIKNDLVEARDQLNQILAKVDAGNMPHEGDYLVDIQHAMHHLNIAWNARRSALAKYQGMTTRDFNRWRIFPDGDEWKQLHRTSASSTAARKSRRG